MIKTEIVCFDLDGTLIINTNSLAYLCKLNGYKKEFDDIEALEEKNEISWQDADYRKVKLMEGLAIEEVEKNFNDKILLIKGIKDLIDYLQSLEIKTLIITSGPVQVADVVKKKFGFDFVFGSKYKIERGKFTGDIDEHLDEYGKLQKLESFCRENNIILDQCIAVGDSLSDTKIFERVGKAIAINYSEKMMGKAHKYIKTDDIKDIIGMIS